MMDQVGEVDSHGSIARAFWDVAEEARQIHGGTFDIYALNYSRGFLLREIVDRFDFSYNKNQHMEHVTAPWFWMSFLVDQSVTRSGRTNATHDMEYFIQHLSLRQNQNLDHFYASHVMMAFAKRAVVTRFDPDAGGPGYLSTRGLPAWRNTLAVNPTGVLAKGIHNTHHHELYVTFLPNFYRMALFILEDDLSSGYQNTDWMKNRYYSFVNGAEYLFTETNTLDSTIQGVINNVRNYLDNL